THADAIVGAKYLNTVAIQNRKLALGVPKPHAAEAVGKFNDHTCLGKVVAATVRGPDTVGQAVQTVTAKRYPHSSAVILCDRLEEARRTGHLFGQVNADQTTIDETPETICCAEPDSLVRTAAYESHISAPCEFPRLNLAVRNTKELRPVCACHDPHRPLVICGHRKVCTIVLWELLSDQRAIEEPVDATLLAKPDIAFAIDQLRKKVRIQVVSFRITGRSLIKGIGNACGCSYVQHDWLCSGYPDALGSVDNLIRRLPKYWIGRREIGRMASGFVEKLPTLTARYDPSIGV